MLMGLCNHVYIMGLNLLTQLNRCQSDRHGRLESEENRLLLYQYLLLRAKVLLLGSMSTGMGQTPMQVLLQGCCS